MRAPHLLPALLILAACVPGQAPTPPSSGKADFTELCAPCHGVSAKGDGELAKSLAHPPADLTGLSSRHGGVFPMARVDRIIAGEEQLPLGHGTREMPVWGPIFSQVERDQNLGRVRVDNLTRYLMTLQTKSAASIR